MHSRQENNTAIAFMYNHEVFHQVAHSAPILKALLRAYPDYNIDVLSSTEAQKKIVQECLGAELCTSVNFVTLTVSPIFNLPLNIFNKFMPARRYWMLRQNRELFDRYDAIIVPEWTSVMLKTRFGLEGLKLIFTHHGAGDRSVSYNDNIKDFDFVLLPGRKFEGIHLEKGLVRPGNYAVVGYPKFDFTKAATSSIPKLFFNENPVTLYNPHFDPYLSSWYDMGEAVLDFYKSHPKHNLIFAPHVMLFERSFHTSLERKMVRRVKRLAKRFRNCPNIHIDFGSTRSVDMTYTRAADIYLGDVSSQVYEFIETPRPCVFLNSHGAKWEANMHYRHWSFGPVIDDVSALGGALAQSTAQFAKYSAKQKAAFEDTFEMTSAASSMRAAKAISDYLSRFSRSEKDEQLSHLEAAQ